MKVVAPNLIVAKEELLLDLCFPQACNFLKGFCGQLHFFFFHDSCHEMKMVFRH